MLTRLTFTALLTLVLSSNLWQAEAQSSLPQANPAPGSGAPASAPITSAPINGGEIRGHVKSGNTPLPGVSVSAANTLTGKKVLTSTDVDGSFALTVSTNGRYVVRAELAAFAPVTKEVLINAASPNQQVDLDLILLSRVPTAPSSSGLSSLANASRGSRGSQQLSVSSGLSGTEIASGSSDTPLNLPALAATADATNESLAVSGSMGQTADFGRDIDDMRERIDEMRARGELPGGGGGPGGGGPGGGPSGPGGPGGPGGGPGGPVVFGGGRMGGRMGRFNVNRPHGMLFYSAGDSALDAAPYALNGSSTKPNYSSNRFGATLGAPLKIPGLFDASKNTFVFFNLTGTRSTTPYQVFSHVPTADERNGIFAQSIIDPVTGQAFANNTIPACSSGATTSCLNPAAQKLLNFIPLPTPGLTGAQNYLYSSAAQNDNTNISFRIMHSFGSTQASIPRRGPGGMFGRNNINFGLNYMSGTSDQLKPFASLDGTSHNKGLNTTLGYTFSRGRWTNNLRASYNRSRINTENLYAGVTDVAAEAGITGVSDDPATWGIPVISFSDYQGLSGVVPSSRRDGSYQIMDTVIVSHGKHNVRFGGDYHHLRTSLHSNPNPNGSFTFTGFATGNDLADFLLGYAQQTSIQYSPNSYDFSANAYDLYVNDDWRLRGNLTIQAGLRYEYIGPYSEAHNQLVNLDVNPLFTAAAAVEPGQTGALTGVVFPSSLVKPDRNNFAPRLGLAWKPFSKTVVRAGYGVNYNLSQYRSIVQQLAFQPPFSFTQTNAIDPVSNPQWIANALTLANGFSSQTCDASAGNQPCKVTNNYGVDPDYRLGYVQMWNLNIQRDIGWGSVLNIGYTGSKGTALDMVRAPNRDPNGGLRIDNVQAFLWETSQGSSILHSGSVRWRKRMRDGIAVGATYVYSKSIDNASSIGGGATVVAQNDLDLAAERGLSSFDQRHRFTGDYTVELPFGEGRRWLNSSSGAMTKIFGAWTWSGSFTIASGLPFTARVLGNVRDVSSGTNGTLRANVTGQPIAVSNPSVAEWFNTAAFTEPVSGEFGDAGRNTIIGPGSVVFNMSLAKDFPMRDMMNLEVRLDANNVFNTPQFTGIDTVVNSPTYGQVISVGSTRRIQLGARFRF